MGIFGRHAVIGALFGILFFGGSAWAQVACDTIFTGTAFPKVSNAYSETTFQKAVAKAGKPLGDADKAAAIKASKTIQLGDVVAVDGTDLGKMFTGERQEDSHPVPEQQAHEGAGAQPAFEPGHNAVLFHADPERSGARSLDGDSGQPAHQGSKRRCQHRFRGRLRPDVNGPAGDQVAV